MVSFRTGGGGGADGRAACVDRADLLPNVLCALGPPIFMSSSADRSASTVCSEQEISSSDRASSSGTSKPRAAARALECNTTGSSSEASSGSIGMVVQLASGFLRGLSFVDCGERVPDKRRPLGLPATSLGAVARTMRSAGLASAPGPVSTQPNE